MEVALVLFTRDLRLHDNPALAAAVESAETVLPLFVLDDGIGATRYGSAANRRAFLHESLVDLDASLRRIGGRARRAPWRCRRRDRHGGAGRGGEDRLRHCRRQSHTRPTGSGGSARSSTCALSRGTSSSRPARWRRPGKDHYRGLHALPPRVVAGASGSAPRSATSDPPPPARLCVAHRAVRRRAGARAGRHGRLC